MAEIEEVRYEQLKNLTNNSIFIIIAVIINILVICMAFWDIGNNKLLIYWALSIFIILGFNYYISKEFIKKPKKYSIKVYENLFFISIYLSNIIFSVGIINIFPDSLPFYQTFLAMTITAIAAVAVMSLSADKILIVNYLIILILPLISIFSLESSYVTSLIVLLYSIFLVMLIIFSKKYNKNIIDLIVSKFDFKKAQDEIIQSKEYFSAIFNQAPVGIITFDKDFNIIKSNNEFSDFSKHSLDKLIGINLKELMNNEIITICKKVFDKKKALFEDEYFHPILKKKIWINIQVTPIYNIDKEVISGLAIISDITKRVDAEKKIHQQAFYDNLTGLANRATFNDRLIHQIPLLVRHNRFGAILFIDLDNFKTINDTLGHHVGDDILKSFAKRINIIIREEDTFARLGGDEFVIILSDLSQSEVEAMNLSSKFSEKLHAITKEPLVVYEHSLEISLSIGISLLGIPGQSKDDVLRYADIAMYEAKKSGKNNTKLFKTEMSEKVIKDLNLNNELLSAIKKREFKIYYQPIVNTKTNKIDSCEALIRWEHPTRGLLYPIDFIPFAEQNNLLSKIGDYVIEEVFLQYNKWNNLKSMTLKDIAINISPKQFNKKDFINKLVDYVNKYNVDPHNIKLELTESVVINNLEKTIKKIKYLQNIGFKFSMDDFGTGYSSLSYLKNLPFNYLKIDQVFIKNILEDENDKNLVKTILSISEQFKFKVIAEGVETKEHIKYLKDLGCDYYQGYITSKPICAEDFKELLEDYN